MRKGVSADVVLFLPTICIIEVHGVFAKYRFGKTNPQVKQLITEEEYQRVCREFTSDVENGRLFALCELSREHVAASHLINRIDSRTPKKGIGKLNSADRVIIAIGIQLAKVHGRDNFAILSTDERMRQILNETAALMSDKGEVEHMRLDEACSDIGVPATEEAFPQCLDLLNDTDDQLSEYFDIWPLPPARPLSRPPETWHLEHQELLSKLEGEAGLSIDAMPYTSEFERLYRTVVSATGYALSRREVLRRLMGLRKGRKLGRQAGEDLNSEFFGQKSP